MQNIRFDGETFSQHVYTSALYKNKVVQPRDGDSGWACVKGKEICFVYDAASKLWERPTERFPSRRLRRLVHSTALL